ncbi:MAG TPA: tRNA (N6-threonylcarbamoyladenosine(37)-N6)-methyltransferase TrmO [Phycisphaerae bacterium]|nr:tRNA (N6-threonylcarbamoyladenosine(37)-N6)-methyltransferase TrmO [Phycisphaerae bacterium]
MNPSRRRFLGAGLQLAAGSAAMGLGIDAMAGEPAGGGGADTVYKVYPIGRVEKKDGAAAVRVFDKYVPGLKGLDGWSHVDVFYWFDRNDTPQQRSVLQVHPRGKQSNPLTGVFACRSPVRPNLIALSVCKILGIEGNVLKLADIDAFDGTPVLDLKPFIPPDEPRQGVKVPDWARGGPGRGR